MKIIEKTDLDATLEPHFSTPGFSVELSTNDLTKTYLKHWFVTKQMLLLTVFH